MNTWSCTEHEMDSPVREAEDESEIIVCIHLAQLKEIQLKSNLNTNILR